MENGNDEFRNVVEGAERAVKQMAACGLSHSAKYVQYLIKYTRALDKNQKGLINALVQLQRQDKIRFKIMSKMFGYLTVSQKEYISKYIKELWENDPT